MNITFQVTPHETGYISLIEHENYITFLDLIDVTEKQIYIIYVSAQVHSLDFWYRQGDQLEDIKDCVFRS